MKKQNDDKTKEGTDKVIKISWEVHKALQKLAVPFEDSYDSVLRRLLKIPPKK